MHQKKMLTEMGILVTDMGIILYRIWALFLMMGQLIRDTGHMWQEQLPQ